MADPKNPVSPRTESGAGTGLMETSRSSADTPPEFQVRVSSDKVCVVVDCPDPLADLATTVSRIMAEFGKLEIPVYPKAEQLAEILQKISKPGQNLIDTPIIMGQKAVSARDGRLDWTRDFFSEGWAMDEDTGAVDFWQKLEDRTVHEGDLLVTLVEPVPGEPGLNVFGNEIPVTKPVKLKLRCGKGIHTREVKGGVEYYASVNGRLRYTDGSVAVDDLFVVKGNVCLETGNISHSGSVLIQGDVETGATVEAEGDIVVKGLVEPCTIKCGGSLTVAGGILGDPENLLIVSGDLNARYINEAKALVGGNVMVTSEVSHSEIRARGRISIPKGRVVGGLLQGYKGIRVAKAGTSGSRETKLIAGVDWEIEQEQAVISERIRQFEYAQEKINEALQGMEANQDLDDPDARRVFESLTAKSKQQGRAIADSYAARRQLNLRAKQDAVPEVILFQEIWAGTTIVLGEFKTKAHSTILKPRIAQLRQTRARLLPLGEGNMPED